MFRRLKAAAHAFRAGVNTPVEPVEGNGVIDTTSPLSTITPERWRAMFSGETTTSADRLAAVFGCVQVIASSIAAMPLQLFRKTGDSRERETSHPLARLLADCPNQVMTWTEMREALNYQQVIRGNSYGRSFWSGGNVREIFPIPCDAVTPKLTDGRRIRYTVGVNANKVDAGEFGIPEILHFKGLSSDGIEGINPITHCRMTTASAVALTNYGKNSAQEGAPIRGVITSESPFKNDDQARLVRSRWGEAWKEAQNGGGVAILDGGDMKFHQITMSMRDAQFIESMAFSVEEICRIFNVPPHKVQKLDRATFNNIEHLSREFYMATLVPWINRIEATLNRCLLTAGDRAAGLYLRHNADSLLRGDLATRSESYQKQISGGVMTPNEARALEDRPPMEGGDQLFFPINHVPLSQAGQAPAGPETPPPNP